MGKEIWTFDEIKKQAVLFNRPVDWKLGCPKSYDAAVKKKMLTELTSHMKRTHAPFSKHDCLVLAKKHTTRTQFQKADNSAYNAAWKNGWLEEICTHMAAPKNTEYTYDQIKEASLKYTGRTEWSLKSNGTYAAAQKKGLLKEMTAHMEYVAYPWTEQEIETESKKYKSRTEWALNCRSYWSAQAKGLLDKYCQHMKRQGFSSKIEGLFFLEILKFFPEATRLRLKTTDPSHPAKSYCLDVFVPSLKKGIEFDGTYWHSFKGLKTGRLTWSDIQIENYHQNKDLFFKRQGIEILHVKEEDWNTQKEAEMSKILSFLGR